MILAAWLTVLWILVRLLGPFLADLHAAKVKEFEKNHPRWVKERPAQEGLSLLGELGLIAVREVEQRTDLRAIKDDVRRWEEMARAGFKLLMDLAHAKGIWPSVNEAKRTVEDGVTLMKQGVKP